MRHKRKERKDGNTFRKKREKEYAGTLGEEPEQSRRNKEKDENKFQE